MLRLYGEKCRITVPRRCAYRAGAGMKDVLLPKFTLSLLTRFELTGPAGPVELPNKKLAGLLAYLACTAPLPQPRQKLATPLWGPHFQTPAPPNPPQAPFIPPPPFGPPPPPHP